jgi:hypothetical protein
VGERLVFRYDKVGDILHIDKCPPYAEQETELLLDEDIAVRLNPKTDAVETVEILWFKQRLEQGEEIELPLSGELRLTV